MATLTVPYPAVNGTTAHPTQDITAQRMAITPQMAAELLKSRPPNRPISKTRVRLMIEDMRSGRWVDNGETIVLTDHLQVLDGQHRLQAVMESGCTITFLVACGVPQTAMGSIDQGTRRSGADALAAASIPRSRDIAAVSRWLWRVEHEQMRQVGVPLRNQDLPAFVEAHPGLHSVLSWGSSVSPILPASCASACFWLFSQKDAVLAKEYYTALRSGEGLEKGHPALAVRAVAFRERLTMTHTVAVSRAALLVLGWNCTRGGKSCPHGMTWRGEKDATVPFPRLL
jgi:hypothetical protein